MLAAVIPAVARAEGYGAVDFLGQGNSALRAVAQLSGSSRFVVVGRSWTGSQYRAVVGSYVAVDGRHDTNFALSGGVWSGLWGKSLFDFSGAGLDNLCGAITATDDSYIAACRSMKSNGFYEIYLVKFNELGILDGAFGTGGVAATGLGGVSSHALPRGIAYDPVGNTVAVAGSVGTYSPGTFAAAVASYDADDGSEVVGVSTFGDGTAVGIVYDPTTQKFFTASTGITGNRTFDVTRWDTSLAVEQSRTIDFSAAGGGADSVPSGLAIIDDEVIVVGGNRVDSSTPPWRCAVVALAPAGSMPLDTTFGKADYLSGGINGKGISLFSHDGATPTKDCIVNGVATPPSGTDILVTGTAYNGTNYDYAVAKLDGGGVLATSFGTGGIKTVAAGNADDVLSPAIFLGGNATYLYGIGRSEKDNRYNGMAITRFANADGAATTYTSGVWTTTTTTNVPMPVAGDHRYQQAMVWTGSKLVVWSGYDDNNWLENGGVFDPVGNSWIPTNTTNAPVGRRAMSAVWTGDRMLIWGGQASGAGNYRNDGGKYDPVLDAWEPISTTNAPPGRFFPCTAWTGTKLLSWSGFDSGYRNDGGIYDVAGDSWTPITTANAPTGRWMGYGVWTGGKFIVWGGRRNAATQYNVGGVYDPTAGTWTPTSTTNAPSARSDGAYAWTGSEMIVWAGSTNGAQSGRVNTGGRYNPLTDLWTPMTTTNAPVARWEFPGVWTGSKFFIWGGAPAAVGTTSGVYDPTDDSWTLLGTTNAINGRSLHQVLWTGKEVIIWGGAGNTPQRGAFVTP